MPGGVEKVASHSEASSAAMRPALAGAGRKRAARPREGALWLTLSPPLRSQPSQEKAAESLDLPFTTYRRYRDRGIEALTAWLWDLDIDSR